MVGEEDSVKDSTFKTRRHRRRFWWTRKKTMQLHGRRAAQFEYLKPGSEPVPFESEKHTKRIFNVVDAIAAEAEAAGMKMVLRDGKWRLMNVKCSRAAAGRVLMAQHWLCDAR